MRNLSYYKNLKYKEIVLGVEESEGGGYEAWIEEFGRATCVGSGDTKEEALANLESMKNWVLETWVEEGREIPLPAVEDDLPSGRFTVRIAAELHQKLMDASKKNNVSFNTYVGYLLATRLDYDTMMQAVKDAHTKRVTPIANPEMFDIPAQKSSGRQCEYEVVAA